MQQRLQRLRAGVVHFDVRMAERIQRLAQVRAVIGQVRGRQLAGVQQHQFGLVARALLQSRHDLRRIGASDRHQLGTGRAGQAPRNGNGRRIAVRALDHQNRHGTHPTERTLQTLGACRVSTLL